MTDTQINNIENIGNDVKNTRLSNIEIAELAIAVGLDKKATRPILIDLRPQEAFTEYFAIVSVSSGRQAVAISETIRMFFKQHLGLNPMGIDGTDSQSWILMDYGAVFVHIFIDSTRELYKLEQLWSKGKFIELNEEKLSLFQKTIQDQNPIVIEE